MSNLIALILHECEPTYPFTTDFGLYLYSRHILKQSNIEIIDCYVQNKDDIINSINKIDNHKIKLLWLRGHGTRYSITFKNDHINEKNKFCLVLDESKKINSADTYIKECFNLLPLKLDNNAYIFLDSCSNGEYVETKTYKKHVNMASEFANLTIDMPNVQIIAAKEPSHLTGVLIENESYKFIQMNTSHQDVLINYGINYKAALLSNNIQNIDKCILQDRDLVLYKDECINTLTWYAYKTRSNVDLRTIIRNMLEDTESSPEQFYKCIFKYLTPDILFNGNEQYELNQTYLVCFNRSCIISMFYYAQSTLHLNGKYVFLPSRLQQWAKTINQDMYDKVTKLYEEYKQSILSVELSKKLKEIESYNIRRKYILGF
jgi:hypothetical protein